MIRQSDLDLITDSKAFTPQPVKIEAPWWLNLLGQAVFLILVFGVAICL